MEKLLGLPVLASEHGKDVDNFIIYIHWLMIALFVGWIGYFLYVLWRFRGGRNKKADYIGVKTHASTWIELAVVVVEAVLLIGLAIPLWAKMVDKLPTEQESTVLRVIAQQFAWNARYPGKDGVFGKQEFKLVTPANRFGLDANDPKGKDDLLIMNELHVPLGKPVFIHLSSLDVIHSFKVIAFRTTQDAIPGMSIPLWFKPTRIGKYQINCAQLCGMGHYSMSQGFITVETPEKYQEWVASKTGAGKAADYE